MYAPPGTLNGNNLSEASYSSEHTLGSSTSISSSLGLSTEISGSIGDEVTSASFGVSVQTETTKTDSLEVSSVEGTTITINGKDSYDGINHDDDLFRIWVNPQINIKQKSPNLNVWGLSNSGPADDGAVILEPSMSDLKKGLLMDAEMLNDFSTALKNWYTRTGSPLPTQQVLNESLTAMFKQILAANPFSDPAFAIHYDSSKSNNRFIPQADNATIQYSPGKETTTYYIGSSTNTSKSIENTTTVEVTFGAKDGIEGIASLETKTTLNWSQSVCNTASQGSTKSASATIFPPTNSVGHSLMKVYLDTTFNTWVWQYYN
jgi:hypothetical protein